MRAQIEATKSPSLAITTLSLATARVKLVDSATAAKIVALFASLLHALRIVRMRTSPFETAVFASLTHAFVNWRHRRMLRRRMKVSPVRVCL